MLSIGKLSPGREDYYLSCLAAGADEYYTHPGEEPGYWLGAAAPALGLAGTVAPDQFRAVLAGRHPASGDALVQGAGHRRRVAGFDLTFSAPKSVSVAWALGHPELAKALAAAHDQAVTDTLSVFETEALRARRGHNGLTQVETDGVAAAAFPHRTSRAGDPHVHTHVVIANLTVDAAGRWSAPDGRRVYGWAKTLGYLYQSALRHHLAGTLGVAWGPVRNGAADLAGIPASTLAAFSQRRAQITAEMERQGFDTARAARIATLSTRPAKDPPATLGALRDGWAHRAARLEPLDLDRLLDQAPPPRLDAGRLIDELVAPEGLTAGHSSFDRRDVLRALAQAQPHGAAPAELLAAADQVLAHPAVVALGTDTPVGGRRYSTLELLAVEASIVAAPARRAGAGLGVVPVAALERALAGRPSLAGEQRAMVARLTRSGAGVEVVVGRAGSGKTFALDAARAAWQNAGHPVVGAALAARAAAELEAGAGIASVTLDRLLLDVERSDGHGGFAPHTVVVLDEAAMVGSRKLARLLAAAEASAAKVVLVGDHRQLPAIDAGGAFAALTRSEHALELVENRRQREPWERAALAELRAGSVPRAVAAYAGQGRIHVYSSADAARDAMVADWWAARADNQGAAMWTPRRAETEDLNRRARRLMAAAGRLGPHTVAAAGREFAVGDEVLLLRNDRRLQVRNGTLAQVAAVDPAAGTITITTDDRQVELPARYLQKGHVAHGYARTTHKGQGANVERSFLLGSDALYRELGYSGLSRASTRSDLYMVDAHQLAIRNGIEVPLDPPGQLARHLQITRAEQLALEQLPTAHARDLDQGHAL